MPVHDGSMEARKTLWLGLLGGCFFTVAGSVTYLAPSHVPPFLLERPSLGRDVVWLTALRVHVACGVFCLPAGLLLCSRGLPSWHAALGRAYGVVVLCLMAPTGVYLAAHAKYGWAAGSGFLLSAIVAALTTADAIRRARQRDDRRHRHAALRSYAQVASAITFRLYHLVFQLSGTPYELNYIASVWLSVAGNALAVELWIHTQGKESL